MLDSTTRFAKRGVDYTRHDLNVGPLVVFYETTQACDLVCKHCRACAQTQSHPEELTTAESRLLLQQLARFPKPPMVVLTGGDPLKRSDIYDLIEYGVERGLKVSITPSATPLVTLPALRRLRNAGISRLAVSLDGVDAATHDAFRGIPGSFQRTLQILSNASTLELPAQVNTTITPGNYRQIDTIADLLAAFPVVLWSVFFLVPVGRGSTIRRLNPEEYEQVFERLWVHARQRPYAIKTTEAPHYRRFVLQQNESSERQSGSKRSPPRPFSTLGVNDGKGVMFIGHTGNIQPSGFLPICCGNFPQDNPVEVYQRSPVMKALRDPDQLSGKCRLCKYRNVCGGSRARAYAVTGDFLAEEPDCCYQPSTSNTID